MRLLSQRTYPYNGYTVQLKEFDTGSGGPDWCWEVSKDGVSLGDNSKGCGASSVSVARIEAERHIDWLIDDFDDGQQTPAPTTSLWDKADRVAVVIAGGAALGSAIAQIPGAVVGAIAGAAYGLIADGGEQLEDEQERDRWWLERAIEFEVDRLNDRHVILSKSSGGWSVVHKGLVLGEDGFSSHYYLFGDRESAYSAYLQWKEQQEGD